MNKHLQPDERLCDVYSKDDHYGAIIAALLAFRAALRIKENVAATRSRNARSANQAKNVEITRQFQEDNRALCASVHDRNMVYPSQSADAPLTVHFNLHVECTPERAANILKALYTQGLIP